MTDKQASPVEVEIKNWSDHPAKPRLIKHSTFSTYILDATNGTTNPRFMQIAGYEPHRLRCHIVASDYPVAVLNAPPKQSPDPAGGVPTLSQAPVYNQISGTFPTTTANSLALPVSFESITGFTVNFQGGAAVVSGQLSVTNVVGGSIFYLITVPTTGLNFQVAFPNPLLSTGVAPTVNVPNFAAGPYSITVTGTYANGLPVPSAPEGAYISNNSLGRDFFGPDALWINTLTGAAATRVTVIKEYC